MPRLSVRRTTAVGLAFCFILVLAGTAWMERREAKEPPELAEKRRWLRDTVIVVDPGHGGDDPGAVVGATLEKGIVLEIGKTLKAVLERQGVRVLLTRANDEDLGGRIREELGRRVAIVEQHKPHVFVSIHANKDTCNCWGAQTFYQRNGDPAGMQLAMAIQNQMRRLTPTTRVALPADYFVLRKSPVPAAMVEVGFLTNAREHQRLKDPEYQHTLSVAIALGVADFLRSQVPEAKAQGSIGK